MFPSAVRKTWLLRSEQTLLLADRVPRRGSQGVSPVRDLPFDDDDLSEAGVPGVVWSHTPWPLYPAFSWRPGIVQVVATQYATAALLDDGAVLVWGAPPGDAASAALPPTAIAPAPPENANTHKIMSLAVSGHAFVGMRQDWRLVQWYGGPVSTAGAPLLAMEPLPSVVDAAAAPGGTQQVHHVLGTESAFAAVLTNADSNNKTVVAWGEAATGGTLPTKVAAITDASTLAATSRAFAVRCGEFGGTVVAWGDAAYGGEIPQSITDGEGRLLNVVNLFSNAGAFVARRGSGDIVVWGHADFGGSSEEAPSAITARPDPLQPAVHNIVPAQHAFAAQQIGGDIHIWGKKFSDDGSGTLEPFSETYALAPGDTTGLPQQLVAARSAFATRLMDGRVLAWGTTGEGGNPPAALTDAGHPQFSITMQLEASRRAFASRRVDGSVVSWGAAAWGGGRTYTPEIGNSDTQVTSIVASETGFLLRRADGRVMLWVGDDQAQDTASLVVSPGPSVLPDATAVLAAAPVGDPEYAGLQPMAVLWRPRFPAVTTFFLGLITA